jgi:rhodanese-related sulfurtransferase
MSQLEMNMHELKLKLPTIEPDELILDVREPEEFASGHVPGAINIPHEQVLAHKQTLAKYRVIYLYCRTGRRAIVATNALNKAGLNQIYCIGTSGILDWVSAGYPVEK